MTAEEALSELTTRFPRWSICVSEDHWRHTGRDPAPATRRISIIAGSYYTAQLVSPRPWDAFVAEVVRLREDDQLPWEETDSKLLMRAIRNRARRKAA